MDHCRRTARRAARDKRGEGRIDLAAGAGVNDLDLQPHGAGGRFHVSQRGLGSRSIGRIDEHGHTSGSGHQFAQEFQPLCRQLATKKLTPVRLPPGRARLATRPSLTGSSATRRRSGSSWSSPWPPTPQGELTVAAITATCRRTSRPPAPAADRFDSRPSGIRSPRCRLRQSRLPSVPAEIRAASVNPSSDWALRNPITGIAVCCAPAASGHAAAPRERDKIAPFQCPIPPIQDRQDSAPCVAAKVTTLSSWVLIPPLGYGSRLLHCGIFPRPLTAAGQSLPSHDGLKSRDVRCWSDSCQKIAGPRMQRSVFAAAKQPVIRSSRPHRRTPAIRGTEIMEYLPGSRISPA